MSLFDKKRSVTALSKEAIDSIKQDLQSMLSIAASYDQVMMRSGELVISLEGRIRGDLLAFALYLDGVGKGKTDPKEIEVVNQIFDIDLSHVDFEIFRNDVGNKSFESSVPPSALILNEMGKAVQREQFRKSDGNVGPQGDTDTLSNLLVADLINLYALIGSAFITADGQALESESNDLIRYLCMINRALNGPDAPLPAGPAQRVYQAHIRLFGRKPKVR
ncbi:MAG: hypothetical protein Q4A07_05535 [Coriobacteriales bacterium]|nr:hypothetical protein [Coriobacteriales bacterium]